jgi:hypothetical protein
MLYDKNIQFLNRISAMKVKILFYCDVKTNTNYITTPNFLTGRATGRGIMFLPSSSAFGILHGMYDIL